MNHEKANGQVKSSREQSAQTGAAVFNHYCQEKKTLEALRGRLNRLHEEREVLDLRIQETNNAIKQQAENVEYWQDLIDRFAVKEWQKPLVMIEKEMLQPVTVQEAIDRN